MRRWLFGLALLCAAGITGWYLVHVSRITYHVSPVAPAETSREAPAAPAPGKPPAASPARPQPPPAAEAAPIVAAAPASVPPAPAQPSVAAPDTASLPPCDLPGATVLENMRTVFRSYTSRFGGNPVGTNPEITRALNGDNPKQARFINPESGLRINAQGELVDAWGTPFFFHQLSGTVMEIHSAGPDHKMWTADDLVTK